MSIELRRQQRQNEQERRRLNRKHRQLVSDVQAVAAKPEGKRLLQRILANADIFNPCWTPGEAGAYLAGKKAQALELWRIIRQSLPPGDCLDLILPQQAETSPDPRDYPEEHNACGDVTL